MDFKKLIEKKNESFNEEQTKLGLILPVIDRFLGWDPYDHKTFIPEFTADVPGRKGEKVDYALAYAEDADPIILLEAKPLGDLTKQLNKNVSQLYRYFATTKARIGILTDGFTWMLYSDLDRDNLMDSTPFLEFTLEDLERDPKTKELFSLLSFSKADYEKLIEWGSKSREASLLEDLIIRELSTPTDDFVKFFFKSLNPNETATYSRLEQFRPQLKASLEKILEKPRDNDLGHLSQHEERARAYDESPLKTSYIQRKGYFRSNEGHEGVSGSLKRSWVSFWADVANDPTYRGRLLEYAKDDSKAGISMKESSFNEDIGQGMYLHTNLSSSRRETLLHRISNYIGISSEIIYEDL